MSWKNIPVAWMEREKENIPLNGYFLCFWLARNASVTGCTKHCTSKASSWHLASPCHKLHPKKWFNFPPVSDVYKWPTPPTAHARNVRVPTFLVPHSNWRIFFPELTWNESGFSTDVCENAKWEMEIRCFERPNGTLFAKGCSLLWQPWPWNL